MELQDVTALFAIDLSTAFDTVDHNILVDVLHNRYGIHSFTLDWLTSI